ncbi:MAG: malto-oligosyltrehalose synthase [bacterium]|nr:malto-oligosyltrehalose synthase [bacterium]
MPASPSSRPPVATYRLQLHGARDLRGVLAAVDYLRALGISHAYLAPVLRARTGSTHGYDVVDHAGIDPVLGTDDDFTRLAEALRLRGMGILLDVVPNHMSVGGGENAWWQDVLENGPSAASARCFDVDWTPPKAELAGRVLLPVLGDQYGRVLEAGELRVAWDDGGFVAVAYGSARYPLAPKSWQAIVAPVAARLRATLGDDDVRVAELESIATALEHLPARDETDPERRRERQREKEVVKRRLRALVDEAPVVREALDAVLAALNGRVGDPHSFDALEALLAVQAWRLSHWQVATDEINYRRFFDVNDLAAIRVEDPEVHAAVHAWVGTAVAKGWLDGLRIDHVDGLFDPQGYLERLPAGSWVVVEKILADGEPLPPSWPVAGTTGYEFLNLVLGVLVDPAAAFALQGLHALVVGDVASFRSVATQCKRLVLRDLMASELTVLARRLDAISEAHRFSRDFTLQSLGRGLGEVMACFPVYRTYLRPGDERPSRADRAHVATAVRRAKQRNPAVSPSLFDFIGSVLACDDPPGLDAAGRGARRDFVLRLQQLTGPVMAKGVEDTAMYRHLPLAALNEVGGEPDRIGVAVDRFHAEAAARRRDWPRGLSATMSHDCKRGEDVRARLAVLSEVPQAWTAAVSRWREQNHAHRRPVDGADAPEGIDEYLLYQTLVGAWPLAPADDAGWDAFVARLVAYARKAAREAKLRTSWLCPERDYEAALEAFVRAALRRDPANAFHADVAGFVAGIVRPGLLNGLAQLVLKVAAPGVPDFYQGTERWDLRLVDPDNRTPVDLGAHARALGELQAAAGDPIALARALLATLPDGRLKLWLTQRALAARGRDAALFVDGDYVPLVAEGAQARRVIAFARRHGGRAAVAIVGRFFAGLPDPPLGAAWGDTVVRLPPGGGTSALRDALAGHDVLARDGELKVAGVLAHLPVALLEGTA